MPVPMPISVALRKSSVAAAVALGLALSSAPARASGGGLPKLLPDPQTLERDAVSVWLVVNGFVFGSVDLGFALGGRPTPPLISVLQILLGGVIAPAWALNIESPPQELRVAAIASIAGHCGLGLINLIVFPGWAERHKSPPEEPDNDPDFDPAYALSVQPHPSGATLHFRGRL